MNSHVSQYTFKALLMSGTVLKSDIQTQSKHKYGKSHNRPETLHSLINQYDNLSLKNHGQLIHQPPFYDLSCSKKQQQTNKMNTHANMTG